MNTKQTEALKLALEALKQIDDAMPFPVAKLAQKVIREALAQPEQETVLPGGGHVPAVPVAVYGYCPECGGAGVMRERRPNGDDKCTNGHKYPSSKALAEQPAQQQEPKLPEFYARFEDGLVSVYQRREDATPLLLLRESLPGKQPAQQEPFGYFRYDFRLDAWVQNRAGLTGTPFYTSPPASKPWVGLTDEEIEAAVTNAVRERKLSWLGFRKDDQGEYTIPVLSPSDYQMARVIEAKLREKNT